MARAADNRGELIWEGDHERLHIRSRFTAESLLDKDLIASTYTTDEVKVLPDASLIHLGGLSIMDHWRVIDTGLRPAAQNIALEGHSVAFRLRANRTWVAVREPRA